MYIIRADGNANIGAGHLMRCLTVAEALAERLCEQQWRDEQPTRGEICFVCADEQSAAMVSRAGFAVKVLDTDYRDMESELPEWERFVKEVSGKAHILVDSYYVTDAYLEGLKAYGRLYLMDDMQEHRYPADVVINYNAFADRAVYRRLYDGTGTACFVGSRYVPVRSQFLYCEYKVAPRVRNVLITTGGGDRYNIAGEILNCLCRREGDCGDMQFHDVKFHIVTGRYNPNLEALHRMANTLGGVQIYHDVSDMAGLMQKCDMAVTAGGTTIYELSAIGVPFLCFSYARNQEALTEYIGKEGIAGFAGAYHLEKEAVLERMEALFTKYCEDYELRRVCCEKERIMIDGRGAVRLAEKLMQGENDSRKQNEMG